MAEYWESARVAALEQKSGMILSEHNSEPGQTEYNNGNSDEGWTLNKVQGYAW